MKLRHHLGSHIRGHLYIYKTTGAVAVSSLLLIGAFFVTRQTIPSSELSFTEYSSSLGKEAGSVVPASCESQYNYYHPDTVSSLPFWNSEIRDYSAPATINSPSPQYYSSSWYCGVYMWNTGARDYRQLGAGTDAQAWAQCKAIYDSYAPQNRMMEYFGPYYDYDGFRDVSCYTPPAPTVNVQFN